MNLEFIKWLFKENYTKRYFMYMIIGILASFVTVYALLISMLLLICDFTIDILKERYNDFLKEQESEKV